LTNYRNTFTSRHSNLARVGGNFDYKSDFEEISLRTDFFNGLIQNPEYLGHYLVAHYMCDSGNNHFKNLKVALCIKRKISAEVDEILSPIYDTMGNEIPFHIFLDSTKNYGERLKEIKKHVGDFNYDRQGRAHKIIPTMTKVVQAIFKRNSVRNEVDGSVHIKDMYLYYIVDKKLENRPTISVAFADSRIVFPLVEPEAYDHGTACCPIKA